MTKHVFNEVEATMRDGAVLRADVYQPIDQGPWPVLLARTPYGKQDPDVLARLDPMNAMRRGYLVVIQDTRGRHGSDGDWRPLAHERDDGHDSIRWAGRLPGADGRVAMYGPSYLGHTQWAALADAPTELLAAVPAFTWSDPEDGLISRGGAYELGLIVQWTLTLGADVLRRRLAHRPAELREELARLAEAIDGLATRTYWELSGDGGDPPVLRRFDLPTPHRTLGSQRHTGHRALTAATLTVAGWYDSFLQGSLDNHLRARESGSPARLIVGPWSHGNQGSLIGEVDFGPGADSVCLDGGASLHERELDWLDRALGRRPPPEDDPPVLIFVMGTNEWRRFDQWPPPATDTAWYCRADGVLSTTAPSGREPPEHEPPDSYRHDPGDPVPTVGGSILLTDDFPAGPHDQARVESRADVLVYTSAPLTEPIEVIGRIRAVIVAASTAPSADWVVRLCDVDTDGVSRNITDGVLRADHPGRGPLEHSVDLWSTAHVFQRGHRLRLQIASSNFPRWDRNLGPAVQTVYHDGLRTSHIILPTLGSRSAGSAASAPVSAVRGGRTRCPPGRP